MTKLHIAHLNAACVELNADDLIQVADGPGWFFGFESDEGNESPLTGPYESEDAARQAARDLVNAEFDNGSQ